ncbi:hypothetical protein [Kitasatospora sp. NPDC087314]|uniref:hypothetical protein n=1 Tax=Kitasatospora sp. NPDC087314 TaxID=3364068 RepID=UPI00381D5E30
MPPYQMGPAMWPLAILLLLALAPKRIKQAALLWLRWTALAIAVLLLLPYVL